MTRKDMLGVCGIILATVILLVLAWFFQVHPVVPSPENTQVLSIAIDSEEEQGADFVPLSPEEEQQILTYLSTAKERHTTKRALSGGYDAKWKCMTVMLALPNGQVRNVLLAPCTFDGEDPFGVLNTSYPASGTAGFLQTICTLEHPKEVRAFLDDVLSQQAET